MKTNLENLQNAAEYWRNQHNLAKATTAYVVASRNGLWVLANNMAVMLAGACKPVIFGTVNVATAHMTTLRNQPFDFDGATPLEVMGHDEFCEMQMARFEIAMHTARVADAFVHQNAVAA